MPYLIPIFIAVFGDVAIFRAGELWQRGQNTDSALWAWALVGLLFVGHPLCDGLMNDWKMKPLNTFESKVAGQLFRLIFPLNVACLVLSFRSLQVVFATPEGSWLVVAGVILSAGIFLGVFGINSAHEFIHRESRLERSLGVVTLMLVNFASFRINHVDIHHRWVATPTDPTTARKGENLYLYWLRSYFGGWGQSFAFEQERLAGKSAVIRVLQNRLFLYTAVSLLGSLMVFAFGGAFMLFSWWAISLIAMALLQTVDFVEHYGLVRKELKPGIFEAIKPQHSWDSDSFLTNSVLFNLGLHSHHHTRSQLHFTELRRSSEARKMKYGYSVMFLVALVPPLWRSLVDPLLAPHD